MRPAAIILLACACLGLPGCLAVGPDYKRPVLDAPSAWSGAAESPPGQPAPVQARTAWWKGFGDPVLDRLLADAVASNLDVAQARARILQARAEAKVATAALAPMLTASGAATTSYSDPAGTATGEAAENASPAYPGTTWQGGAGVSWELDVFGGLRRQREQARASLDASVEDLNATVLALLADVAGTYVDLRRYQTLLYIARRSARSQADNAAVTRERWRIGLVSHLDVSQAEAQLASTNAEIPARQASVKACLHRLGVLLGRDPSALVELLGKAAPLPEPGPLMAAGLPSELLERRPDLRRAERRLAAASAAVGAATAKQYPSFDLTMGLGLQGNMLAKFLGLANWYWSVVPAVSAPVFDAGKSRAGVEKSRAAYDEALAAYRQAFLTALEEVENALVAISAQRKRAESLDEAIKANETALTLARERYAKGLTSFLDVLSAEKALLEAQENACSSRAGLLSNMVTLYKALGGGWASGELGRAGDQGDGGVGDKPRT